MELMRFLDQKVEEYRQFQHFWPFYKARLQHKEATLPEFKVDFSTIELEQRNLQQKRRNSITFSCTLEKRKNQTRIISESWYWDLS